METMKQFVMAVTILALGVMPLAAGNVYLPKDQKEFKIKEDDIVRFTGPSPGSTGIKTEVKVTMGKATVTERTVYAVKDGMVVRPPGSGPLEFDVVPMPGNVGMITVAVTVTPPGGKAEVKEYKFEVVK
jgi:hypothetical protein